jgi:alginate O-acetyltransferase complex protein AlgI
VLFNSLEFILGFLPITLIGFFLLGRIGQTPAIAWLFCASLVFYGWWDWHYVLVLLGSITFHFVVGLQLMRLQGAARKWLLIAAIAIDLSALVYFKYADMFIGTWNNLSGEHVALLRVVLPLGISFFTFTQIAFLVDVYENKVKEVNPLHFGLFVTYFPHLIAGPVLHHKEMMPQFAKAGIFRPRYVWLGLGLAVFCVGLAKKVLLADNLSPYANTVFNGSFDGGLLDAWIGVLAYTFQLYFDFSGYSDMAVGLSMMIGVRLPINFFSPYKARNISEFWRRWHMTLSRFLRDYLYIRLGGNRKGKVRRYLNLIATMFLGGLWHGAGWNFAIWGLLHGAYLCVHEAFRATLGKWLPENRAMHVLYVAMTFIAAVWAWVPFRADGFGNTLAIWSAMLGGRGVALPEVFFSSFPSLVPMLESFGVRRMVGGGSVFVLGLSWIVCAALVAFLTPNTYQLFRRFSPALVEKAIHEQIRQSRNRAIRFSTGWAIVLGMVLAVSMLFVSRPSEFLYFQF